MGFVSKSQESRPGDAQSSSAAGVGSRLSVQIELANRKALRVNLEQFLLVEAARRVKLLRNKAMAS